MMEDVFEHKSESEVKPVRVRNTTDLQRLKLEKLMKNPEKPVIIPERPKERGIPTVPDFVRNVMGSSAGAGSGEFHVYRHLRRKEYARQKYMKEAAERERLQDDYHKKLEENKKIMEAKTAKKRAKRLKRKKKDKLRSNKPKMEKSPLPSEESESESDAENKDSVIICKTQSGENIETGRNDASESNDNAGIPKNVKVEEEIVEAGNEEFTEENICKLSDQIVNTEKKLNDAENECTTRGEEAVESHTTESKILLN